MKFLIFLAVFVVNVTALGLDRPQLPLPAEDRELTLGKNPRDFFSARIDSTECRKALADTFSLYRNTKKDLQRLVAKGAATSEIDAKEAEMKSARRKVLAKMDECGECANRKVERRVIEGPASTEVWYISDGSCFVSEPKAFEKMKEAVLSYRHYPRKHDGVDHILDLLSVDATTGKINEGEDKIEKSPFYSFISVRGPEMLGVLTAFSYYFQCFFEQKEKEGKKELVLSSKALKPPQGFQPPDVFEESASGRRKKARQVRLNSVLAQWYLTSDGYVRYWTAGDFGVSLKYIEETGRAIQMETLVRLYERALPE